MCQCEQDDWTNLHYAAAGGDVKQVEFLIGVNANVQAKNKVFTLAQLPDLLICHSRCMAYRWSKTQAHEHAESAGADPFQLLWSIS
jgi:hypothetical protein